MSKRSKEIIKKEFLNLLEDYNIIIYTNVNSRKIVYIDSYNQPILILYINFLKTKKVKLKGINQKYYMFISTENMHLIKCFMDLIEHHFGLYDIKIEFLTQKTLIEFS